MKKILLIITFLAFILNLSAQNVKTFYQQKDAINNYISKKGELYFRFYTTSKETINRLSRIISIDNVIDNGFNYEVRAYANKTEIENFAKENIDLEVLKHPGDVGYVKMGKNQKEILAWNTYPTYGAYLAMMNNFQTQYPSLCKIVNIGPTVQNRQLLCAKISDSVNFRKNKPQFFYSSSAHGDELTGYVSMLRLIDTLLKGYGINPKITYLVKNCEIWINPLANPDGTFHGGDSTVNGATRYNASNVDLNRNFPDPGAGPYPTGPWQPEVIAMMNMANAHNFVMSVTFHGGAELYSYPWGTWSRLPPDDDWYIHVAKHYVDTVHSINPNYMIMTSSYPNIPGITNSYSWYRIVGGKKDYIEYYVGGREVSIELSMTKLIPPANLPTYWNYNFKSFLNYIQECTYGIRGIVTDSVTNLPLKAKIRVVNKEISDSTWVKTDSVIGNYHRLIYTGNYTLIFSAPNYYSKTITNVYAKNDSTTILNVKLRPIQNAVKNENQSIKEYLLHQNYPNPFNPLTKIKYQIANNTFVTLKVYDILGEEIAVLVNKKLLTGEYEANFDGSNLPSGIYFYKLFTDSYTETKKMILIK